MCLRCYSIYVARSTLPLRSISAFSNTYSAALTNIRAFYTYSTRISLPPGFHQAWLHKNWELSEYLLTLPGKAMLDETTGSDLINFVDFCAAVKLLDAPRVLRAKRKKLAALEAKQAARAAAAAAAAAAATTTTTTKATLPTTPPASA